MEAENATLSEGWRFENELDDFSGKGYITWVNPTHTKPDGQGLLAYTFLISKEGEYTVKLRNYHPCEDVTECNDVFLKMNNGEWRKNFNHTFSQWDWNSRQDVDHVFSEATYVLSKGEHTLYISGRSQNFSIDKIALFHEDSPGEVYKRAKNSEWK
jgi:hypothetical protein